MISTQMTDYQECIEECLRCVRECNHCYEACLQDDHVAELTQCILLTRDCAEICSFTAAALSRNSTMAKEICALCAEICEQCGKECAKHEHHAHCKRCAQICFQCAEACRQMAA